MDLNDEELLMQKFKDEENLKKNMEIEKIKQ